MSGTELSEKDLKARVELLEATLKDAHGFILAKFAFENDPDAIEMQKLITEALWPMPANWRKGDSKV